jgi:ubiquinone/menaquinone biosynthesis C-methylase UbiE
MFHNANASLDFGYPWWLSYGHLVILAGAGALLFLGFRRNWARWAIVVLGGLTLWAGTAFLLIRFGVDINGQAALPTERFLSSGQGRVLDLGAGTGRSSIMVLAARPNVTLVASDLFADSYTRHFGSEGSPQERLLANLKAAGVEQRATIATADMRKLPFENATFDAVVTSYAIDHLGRDGSRQALSEIARVVKPGGELLLSVVENDKWAKFAFGPLLSHGGTRGAAWWAGSVKDAGFQIVEQGTTPATMYILARRP